MFQAPPQSDALENRPLGMTGRSKSEKLFLDSVLWFSCVPMFCFSLLFCFIWLVFFCILFPYISVQLSFLICLCLFLFLLHNHLLKKQPLTWSSSAHRLICFHQACPFGPDPYAPTTGQRSRCNRHSQPTHQTYGERCRWWIATEPCLPELLSYLRLCFWFCSFPFLLLSRLIFTLVGIIFVQVEKTGARFLPTRSSITPTLYMQTLQARVWVKLGFSMISDARTVHKKPEKNAAERIYR